MTREIKFRAKSLDGIWEYGDLHLRCKHPHIHNLIGAKIYIDQNTIGQFTGLHDKNGKEIYEGDIIRSSNGVLHRIEFDNSTACFTAVRILNSKVDMRHGLSTYKIEQYMSEVIGNIYNNPELLKEE